MRVRSIRVQETCHIQLVAEKHVACERGASNAYGEISLEYVRQVVNVVKNRGAIASLNH